MRSIFRGFVADRHIRAEKKRMQFVKVRKMGGGARERERRRIGGFYTLRRKQFTE